LTIGDGDSRQEISGKHLWMKASPAPFHPVALTILLRLHIFLFAGGFLEKDQYKSRQYKLTMYAPAGTPA